MTQQHLTESNPTKPYKSTQLVRFGVLWTRSTPFRGLANLNGSVASSEWSSFSERSINRHNCAIGTTCALLCSWDSRISFTSSFFEESFVNVLIGAWSNFRQCGVWGAADVNNMVGCPIASEQRPSRGKNGEKTGG